MPELLNEYKLDIGSFKKGTCWWLTNPIRVGKVTGKLKVQVKQRDSKGIAYIETLDAVTAHCCIPFVKVPGFTTPEMERQHKKLGKTLRRCDMEWTETWTSRSVPGIVEDKRLGIIPKESIAVAEVYCLSTEGRPSGRESTSPIAQRRVEAAQIPLTDIPADLFEMPAGAVDKDGEELD